MDRVIQLRNMSVKIYIRRAFHLLVFLWAVFLGFRVFNTDPGIVFTDLLQNLDVSSQFRLEYSPWRIIFEPFYFLVFCIADKDLLWVIPFAIAMTAWLLVRAPRPTPLFIRVNAHLLGRYLLLGLPLAVILRFVRPDLLEREGLRVGLYGVYAIVFLTAYALVVGKAPFLRLKAPNARPRIAQAYWEWLALATTLNYFVLTIPWPNYRIVAESANLRLADFHVHTQISDGLLSTAQRLRWYQQYGVEIAAFTDHNTVEGSQRAAALNSKFEHPLFLITGQEYSIKNPLIHLNLLGYEDGLVPDPLTGPMNEASVRDAVETVRRAGGEVILNHYYVDLPEFSVDHIIGWGITGIEVANGWPWELSAPRVAKLVAACKEHDLLCISGSDSHTNGELRLFTAIDVPRDEPITTQKVWNEIHQQRHQIVHIRDQHEVILLRPAWRAFSTIAQIVNYVGNITHWRALSFLLWILVAYGIGFWRRRN